MIPYRFKLLDSGDKLYCPLDNKKKINIVNQSSWFIVELTQKKASNTNTKLTIRWYQGVLQKTKRVSGMG